MVPKLEMRHLHAVIILAEELNFTRAAHRLNITQPALSKQIHEIEEQNRFRLFIRDKKRVVELTDAGRIFVEEARSTLLHADRAVHLARGAHQGYGGAVLIGHSLYSEHAWISTLLAIRLPLYPKLKVRLMTQFAMELVRSVLAGELNLALVTAPPPDSQITAVPFAETPLYAALLETHPAAHKDRLKLQDLANDEWILLARRVDPSIHDAILDTARSDRIAPKDAHDIITAQQAVHLIREHAGIAILPKPVALSICAEDVAVRPLCDRGLSFETCLVIRKDDDSRIVNEFARSFLRKHVPQRVYAKQLELPLSA